MPELVRGKNHSKHIIPPERITPEGFKRGTKVQFKDAAYPHLGQIADCNFAYGKQYTVISVFQGTITRSGKPEVTLRDDHGDCYGYVPSYCLELYVADIPVQS